ncbi:MAG: hypothetical protein AB8G14_03410 [Ilumatobacter sp.]
MTGFPPPDGPRINAVPRVDPWVEQQRREREHHAAVWRRRRRWLVPLVGVVVLASIAAGAFVVIDLLSNETPEVLAPQTTIEPVVSEVTTSTLPPEELVRVGEVWLIDRGDGVYDWGIIVLAPAGAGTRSGVDVEVRLLDAEGAVVESADATLDGVDADSSGGVAGRSIDPDRVPVRLEFDVGVGVEADEPALDDLLELRAVERNDDAISGRVRSSSGDDVVDVTMLLVWRDEGGDIVATVPAPISRVRPGVDARFDIDLSGEQVPAGVPDDVMWVV